MSMRNSNNTIGNRTRDLPACSAVPQPTVPPRALRGFQEEKKKSLASDWNRRERAISDGPQNTQNCHLVWPHVWLVGAATLSSCLWLSQYVPVTIIVSSWQWLSQHVTVTVILSSWQLPQHVTVTIILSPWQWLSQHVTVTIILSPWQWLSQHVTVTVILSSWQWLSQHVTVTVILFSWQWPSQHTLVPTIPWLAGTAFKKPKLLCSSNAGLGSYRSLCVFLATSRLTIMDCTLMDYRQKI